MYTFSVFKRLTLIALYFQKVFRKVDYVLYLTILKSLWDLFLQDLGNPWEFFLKIRLVKAHCVRGLDSAVFRVCIKPQIKMLPDFICVYE